MTVESFFPQSRYARITLLMAICQAAVVIGLESYIASFFLSNFLATDGTPAKGIPVYLMIFLFSQIFQIVLCWDALIRQNTIQIIGFVIFSFCNFAYSLFQYFQLKELTQFSGVFSNLDIERYLIAIIAVLGVSLVFFTVMAFNLYLEFGWKIYKKIGADPKMKNMYRAYQIFLTILKLDFFFFVAFSTQFIVLVLNPSDPEFTLTIIAVPVTVMVLFLAVYGLRREDRILMVAFMLGCLLAMSYFIFKLIRMYDPVQEYKYSYSRRYLTFFAALSLFCVLITFINAIICFSNFGKGIQEHINNNLGGANATGNTVPMQEHKMTLNQ